MGLALGGFGFFFCLLCGPATGNGIAGLTGGAVGEGLTWSEWSLGALLRRLVGRPGISSQLPQVDNGKDGLFKALQRVNFNWGAGVVQVLEVNGRPLMACPWRSYNVWGGLEAKAVFSEACLGIPSGILHVVHVSISPEE